MEKRKKNLLKPWWDKNPDYLPLGAKWRGKWQKGQVKRMIREIDERALDIEIAEKVFGYKVKVIEVTEYLDYGGDVQYPELGYCIWHKEHEDEWEEEEVLPHYSTDIKDAWSIVKKFPVFTIQSQQYARVPPRYYARTDNHNTGESHSDNVSEAICLAALNLIKKNE